MYNYKNFIDEATSISSEYCEMRSISSVIELYELEMNVNSYGLNNISMYSYIFHLKSGYILCIKFFERETEKNYSSIMANRAIKKEISKKWPILYKATDLGNKRIYKELFFMEYDGIGFLGTTFNFEKYNTNVKYFKTYFEEKLIFLFKQYLNIRNELQQNKLNKINIVSEFIADEIKWIKKVNKYNKTIENIFDILESIINK